MSTLSCGLRATVDRPPATEDLRHRSTSLTGRFWLWGAFLALLGVISSPSATHAILTDSSFDIGTVLGAFTSTGNTDQWLQESAVIVGPENGVTPLSVDGMLRIQETGGVTSQVREVIDVSSRSADIDAGDAFVCFGAQYDSPDANALGGALVSACGDNIVGVCSPQLDFLSTGGTLLDGVTNTWEPLSVGDGASFELPAGTRQVEVQVFYTNGTIPSNGYVDDAFVKFVPEPDAVLSLAAGALLLSWLGRSGRASLLTGTRAEHRHH